MPAPHLLDRRMLLAGAGGALALSPAAFAAPISMPEEYVGGSWPAEVVEDPLAVCMKMRAATDSRLRAGCCIGRYYGIVDGEQTHLFNLLAAAFTVSRRRSDGAFDQRYFEIAYFTNPATGEPLEDWLNPYTQQRVKPPLTRLGPVNSIITKDLHVVPERPFPGAVDRFLPPVILGDHIWLTERSTASVPATASSRLFNYNELTVVQASLSAVNDRTLAAVPATTHTTINVNWRPWMQMDDRPGHMMGGGPGLVVDRVEDLPAHYVLLGRRYHPDFFDDPYGFMTKGWA